MAQTITLSAGQISDLVEVGPGTRITVTGSAYIEYAQGNLQDAKNGVLSWQKWPKGTSNGVCDTIRRMTIRATATGSASVLIEEGFRDADTDSGYWQEQTAQLATDAGGVSVLGSRGIKTPIQVTDRSMYVIGADHQYLQWLGFNGKKGMAELYAKYGIVPYIAVNTDSLYWGNSTNFTVGQALAMQESVEFISHGVTHVRQWELVNTGIAIYYTGADSSASGVVNWTATNGYAKTTSLQLTTSSNTDNITVNITSTTTIADVKSALEATGKWVVRFDPALPGTTMASNLLGTTASVSIGKTTALNGYFACGGGINVYYRQTNATTARNIVFQRPWNLAVLNLYVDGVQVASWDLTNGSYNTLSKVVTAINGAGISGLAAQLANQGGTQDSFSPNFIAGSETSQALRFVENLDVTLFSLSLDAGVPREEMIKNQIVGTKTFADANGLSMTGYAQSGAQMYPHMIVNSPFSHHRVENIFNVYSPAPQVANQEFEQCANVRNHRNFRCAKFSAKYVGSGASATLQMGADRVLRGIVEANIGHADSFAFDTTLASYDTIGELKTAIEAVNGGSKWQVYVQGLSLLAAPNHDPCTVLDVSVKSYDAKYDNSLQVGAPLTCNALSIEREKRAIDAMCASKGYITDVLIHHVLPDGYAGADYDLDAGAFIYQDATETQLVETLRYLAVKRDAGELEVVPPSEAARRMRYKAKPDNRVFNAGFITTGENLMVDESAATNLYGKRVPGFGLIANAANLTSLSAANGELTVVTSSGSTFTPIYQKVMLEPGVYEMGCEFDLDIVAGGAVRMQLNANNMRLPNSSPSDTVPYAQTLAYQSGHYRVRFTVEDDRTTDLPTLIGRNSQPFDLSVNKNVRLNLDNRGLTSDIDCAAGAASSSAVTAKEIAAAINAAIAANATYPAEFHSCAKAVNGKVVIASPYRKNGEAGGVVIAAGTTASASTAIFGGTGVGLAYGQQSAAPRASQFMYIMTFLFNAQGTIKIRAPYIQKLRALA